MTPAQKATMVRVMSELGEFAGWEPNRAIALGRTMHQHNDFIATACPSERYDWDELLSALAAKEEDEMEIIHKPNDHRTYLRTGNVLTHIPDRESYLQLHGLGLKVLKPNDIAWAVIETGCVFKG